ncbi:hypothetical protein K7432_008335 [Basidiobolus ranarum]|uniref:Uncharacterized protein n=1 Tax=Basidiobolus ranarum TaxID=34480 RepID=A0ABR2VZQ0_9FUNG
MPVGHKLLSYDIRERPQRTDSLGHQNNAMGNSSWSHIFSRFFVRRTKKRCSGKNFCYRSSKYEKLELAEAKVELQKETNDFDNIVTHGFSLGQAGSRQPTIRFSLTPKKLRHPQLDMRRYPELSKSF